jgi:hypothetical protein
MNCFRNIDLSDPCFTERERNWVENNRREQARQLGCWCSRANQRNPPITRCP